MVSFVKALVPGVLGTDIAKDQGTRRARLTEFLTAEFYATAVPVLLAYISSANAAMTGVAGGTYVLARIVGRI